MTKLHDEMVEDESEKLDAALRTIYEGANTALTKRLAKHLAPHKDFIEEIIDEVKRGALDGSEAVEMILEKCFTGKKWNKEKQALADILYEADTEATEYANERSKEIYVQSRNYTRYDTEMHYKRKIFDDVLTVIAIQNALPKDRKVKKRADDMWNRRRIQNAVTRETKHVITRQRVKTTKEVVKRVARSISHGNFSLTKQSLDRYLWGISDEGQWEQMLETRDRLGINIQKQWEATLDGHTRDTHRVLDQQIQDLEVPYEVEGRPSKKKPTQTYLIMFPRDPSAAPEMICNCRCRQKYFYPDFADLSENHTRADNTTKPREAIPYMDYEDWEDWKYGR